MKNHFGQKFPLMLHEPAWVFLQMKLTAFVVHNLLEKYFHSSLHTCTLSTNKQIICCSVNLSVCFLEFETVINHTNFFRFIFPSTFFHFSFGFLVQMYTICRNHRFLLTPLAVQPKRVPDLGWFSTYSLFGPLCTVSFLFTFSVISVSVLRRKQTWFFWLVKN